MVRKVGQSASLENIVNKLVADACKPHSRDSCVDASECLTRIAVTNGWSIKELQECPTWQDVGKMCLHVPEADSRK